MLKKYSNEVIVGFFVLVCAVLFLWIYSQLKGQRGGKGTVVYAVFNNANGLLTDNAVTMAGVRVGRVGNIELYKGQARVKIVLYPGIKLHRNTKAAIQAKSLLGEKVLALLPQPTPTVLVKTGETLPDTLPTIDITSLFEALSPMKDLIGLLKDLGPEIKPLAKEITKLVRNINEAIEKDPQGARSLIKQLSLLLKEGRQTVKILRYILIRNRRSLRRSLRGVDRLINDKRTTSLLADLSKTSQQLPGLVRRFQKLSRSLQALLNSVSPRTTKQIGPLITDLRSTIRSFRRFARPMARSGPHAARLLRNLDKIFKKLAVLDEWHIRKFLQSEGVLVHMFGTPSKVRKRIRKLKRKRKRNQ